MLCMRLYDSLFRSSLSFTSSESAPRMSAAWRAQTASRLAVYSSLFAERLRERAAFAARVNGLLAGAELYDAAAMDSAMAQFQAVNARLDREAATRTKPRPCLSDNSAIREHIAADAAAVIEGCPAFQQDRREAALISASGYAVFEAVLIQRLGERFFNFYMDCAYLRAFFLHPHFPVCTADIKTLPPYRAIVNIKTCMSGYAEIMDQVLSRFCGKEYMYNNIVTLVEYYLDLLGYCYTEAYRELFTTTDAALWENMDDYAALFDFHFINFLANIEHMRCAISSMLNNDTMEALASLTGQFNVLNRHQKRRTTQQKRRKEFADLLGEEWQKHQECRDHVDFTAHVLASPRKKLASLRSLFGVKGTRALIVDVLTPLNAVRGLAGFHKRGG